ncbi:MULTISPECIES: type II toxin-antitoxin system VapC family toxin [unclassified Isoptericola]|uniref:type II toxin-antitoxin system VapC family toxin n=1 Tax=unclassified Isoptericola TaxID=2623355 RepID=UPI00365B673E
MIVPDASATVLLFGDPAADPRVAEATRVLRADPEWVVPGHWHIEVLGTLRGLRRGGKITPEVAGSAVEWLRAVTVVVAPSGPYLPRVWQLRDNLSTYDAAYVAVAESHDLTLVTADARLARAAVARCPVRVV